MPPYYRTLISRCGIIYPINHRSTPNLVWIAPQVLRLGGVRCRLGMVVISCIIRPASDPSLRMGFNPPNLDGAGPAVLDQSIAVLKSALSHVFLVIPLSYEGRGTVFTLAKDGPDGGAALYEAFVGEFRPQLEEAFSGVAPEFGLRQLAVPETRASDASDTGKPFVVDSTNYFFRRGAENTLHPAWIERRRETNARMGELEAGKWLQAHRGANFITEMRAHLRRFCAFQHRNWELINAFAIFAFRIADHDPSLGLTLASDTGLPAGLAERLLDYFYMGRGEDPKLLDSIELGTYGEWGWVKPGQEKSFHQNFPRLANAFRQALRGVGMGETDYAGWPQAAKTALERIGSEGVNAFREASKALEILVEMLASRALPQEALAWLLEELFEITAGTREPTTQNEFNAAAKAVKEGKAGSVRAPRVRVLPATERALLQQELLEKLERVVEAATASATCNEREANLKQLLGEDVGAALAADEGFRQLMEVLVPHDAGAPLPIPRESLVRSAKAFLRILFETQILPRLFDSPVLTVEELYQRVLGENCGLMLAALALKGDDAGQQQALNGIADRAKHRISEAIKGESVTVLRGDILKAMLREFLQSVGHNSHVLAERVQFFLEARRLLDQVPASLLGAISGLMALRPYGAAGAIHGSPSLLAERVVQEVVRHKSLTLENAFHAYATYHKALEFHQQTQEAVSHTANLLKDAEQRGAPEDEITTLRRNAEEAQRSEASAADVAKKTEQAAMDQWLVAKASGAPQKDPAGGDSNDSVIASIDDAFRRLSFALPAKVGDAVGEVPPASEMIEAVLVEYRRSPADPAAVRNVLLAFEGLNHLIYRVYAERKNTDVAFCRQVESMTLGRIVLAAGERCGLGEQSSGLLKLLLDLMLETGRQHPDGQQIAGSELLSTHSLYEYLDGGHLQKGSDLNHLRRALQDAAKASFKNITEFISRLQALNYLCHQAPVGSRITLFNGTTKEFAGWLEAQHLGQNGPFSVDAQPGLLPGLVYLADGRVEELDGIQLRRAGGQTGFLIPPVVLDRSSDLKEAAFHWFAVGPAFPLNHRKNGATLDPREPDPEMPTFIPAAFPVLVRFLQLGTGRRSQSLGIAQNQLVKSEMGDTFAPKLRGYKVAGVGPGNGRVDLDVNLALQDQESPWSPAAAFHLYVVLRLYAHCFLQAGGRRGPWMTSFFNQWYQNPGNNEWANLDNDGKPPAMNVKGAFPIGSAKGFCFGGNVATVLATGGTVTLFRQPPSPGNPPIESEFDCDWFMRALGQFV